MHYIHLFKIVFYSVSVLFLFQGCASFHQFFADENDSARLHDWFQGCWKVDREDDNSAILLVKTEYDSHTLLLKDYSEYRDSHFLYRLIDKTSFLDDHNKLFSSRKHGFYLIDKAGSSLILKRDNVNKPYSMYVSIERLSDNKFTLTSYSYPTEEAEKAKDMSVVLFTEIPYVKVSSDLSCASHYIYED